MNKRILDFFEVREDRSWAKCSICGNRLRYQSTTSSLKYHMTRVHNISLQMEARIDDAYMLEDILSPDTTGSVASLSHPPTMGLKPTDLYVVNEAIYKMIAQDMLQLSFSERNGFKNFISVVLPGYNPPGRKAATNNIEKLYANASKNLVEILKCESYFAITTDAWTSTAVESYITITVHFIDEHWSLRTFVLDTVEHKDSHTRQNFRAAT